MQAQHYVSMMHPMFLGFQILTRRIQVLQRESIANSCGSTELQADMFAIPHFEKQWTFCRIYPASNLPGSSQKIQRRFDLTEKFGSLTSRSISASGQDIWKKDLERQKLCVLCAVK